MSQSPTEVQVAAARLRIVLDAKLGRPTPEAVHRIAESDTAPKPEPETTSEETPEQASDEEPVTHARQWLSAPGAQQLVPALGVDLDDQLLNQALTHRSYAYEHGGLPTNERLEFLGDAALGLAVTDKLYAAHPDLSEGQLAKLRAAVVNVRALANVARGLGPDGLGPHLLLGTGEEVTGGRDKNATLADSLEALIGAVHVQHGAESARQLVLRLFGPLLTEVAKRGTGLDWRTSLAELAASTSLGVPEYRVREGGPGDPRFTATAVIAGTERGAATGDTEKGAVQQAAEIAWHRLAGQAGSTFRRH